MKDKVEFVIRPDGAIESVYDDDLQKFASNIGGNITKVCRASNIEWEEGLTIKGWVVRSVHNPSLALRYKPSPSVEIHPSTDGRIVFFNTREEAITQELKFFWELAGRKDDVETERS